MLLAQTATMIALATAAAVSDARHRRVSNRLNLVILLVGLGWRCADSGLSPLVGFGGVAVGLGVLIGPFAARWIGGGDVKLAAALGMWLGPTNTLVAVLVGLAGGGVLALAIGLLSGAALRRDVAATLKLALFTMSAPQAPRRSARMVVPMAIPIGLAAVATFLITRGVL